MFERRYALLGALFGVSFPLIGTAAEALYRHGGLGLRALAAAQSSPLLWIVDSAPIFLGIFARLAGRRQDQAVAAEQRLRETSARAAQELATSTGDLDAQVRRIRDQATAQSRTAAQEAAAITEATTTAAEIARSAERSAARAAEVVAARERSDRLGEEGRAAALAAVQGLEDLGRRVDAITAVTRELAEEAARIGAIAEAVMDLGTRAQVLSLNAGLEATRAGEHGRGFAEVAAQMRSLAEQSRAAAAGVGAVLDRVLGGTGRAAATADEVRACSAEAVSRVRAAAETIDGLGELVRGSAGSAEEIARVASQQGDQLRQIAEAMSDLSTALSGSASGAAAIESAAGRIAEMSSGLDEKARAFRADAS